MKQPIWIAIIAALAFAPAACSKKSDDAGKGGAGATGAAGGGGGGGAGGGAVPSCSDAAAKAVASLGPAGSPMNDVKGKLQAIYTTRCTEDKWPAEVIKCFEAATGMPSLTACREKLPPEVGTKLRAEIMATMAGAAAGMGGGGAPPGHGGAPAGSAAPAAPGGSGAAPAPAPEPPK